jgi:hypothetical protein
VGVVGAWPMAAMVFEMTEEVATTVPAAGLDMAKLLERAFVMACWAAGRLVPGRGTTLELAQVQAPLQRV